MKRLLIGPFLIAVAVLLIIVADTLSILELKTLAAVLVVIGIFVMAYVAVHGEGEHH